MFGDLTLARTTISQSLQLFYRIRNRRGLVACLHELSRISCIGSKPDVATRPLGAINALCVTTATVLPRDKVAQRDETIEALKADLGEEAFAAAWAEGQAMTLDEAVALALQQEPEAT